MEIFTLKELQAMHGYCLKYRDLCRSGKNPSDEQTDIFRKFEIVCYAEGVAFAGNYSVFLESGEAHGYK